MPKNVKNTPSNVDFDGTVFFLALGFMVGLPCFIVGTALFMLGFSTENADLVSIASLLYGIALSALGGRVILRKSPPQTERQALLLGAGALVVSAGCYGVLNATFWTFHLPSGFGG